MDIETTLIPSFEISPRFRQALNERILKLERDADLDERMLDRLVDEDHIRRHRRMVAVQRAEASRMRQFLQAAKIRLPRPLIGI